MLMILFRLILKEQCTVKGWGVGVRVYCTCYLLCHVLLCYCILAFWLPRLWGTDGVLVLIFPSLVLLLGSMSRWMRSSQSTTAYRIDRMTKRVALCVCVYVRAPVPLCQRRHPPIGMAGRGQELRKTSERLMALPKRTAQSVSR
ncbi:hypothetical protein BO79DRAFT_261959 [Aspergillus costaricaensis CBS 115574]|uniref:Uncharacterized protein n=1 Tax=Aspergillus costaricaensis CBS 115574 TaxID=1448317 RepID=A0ACD1IW48_9EURO|nr:hypothetical protein BO79DRAFT_261959 [Aspergillus costaricaensis CBS 115574]RAK94703.1 hypothetical protein BO79DRAFT_261959 [Aspergillus costaricaensis CBS 115574]